MNKTNLFIATTLLFLFIDIVVLYQLSVARKDNRLLAQKNLETEQICASKDTRIYFLEKDIINALNSENVRLNVEKMIVHTGKTSIKLGQVFGNSPKLVLRYSALNCQTCIDVQLALLNKLAESIGRNNIVLIASYKTSADLLKFKRLNKLDFEIYNADSLGLSLEEANEPFYFIFDGGNLTKLVFTPHKEDTALTKAYFEVVLKRFFSQNTQ